MIRDLVGLRWEYGKMDCWKLMVLAQKELWGRNIVTKRSQEYTPLTLKGKSADIPAELSETADRVDVPDAGDVAVLSIHGFCHVATFVSPFEVLHIYEGTTSRISRYSDILKRRTVGIYRFKEAAGWPER